MKQRKGSARHCRVGHAACPTCQKRRARRHYEQYRFGIVRFKCRNCGEDFWLWKGKTWLHPEGDKDLREALVAAGELQAAAA